MIDENSVSGARTFSLVISLNIALLGEY